MNSLVSAFSVERWATNCLINCSTTLVGPTLGVPCVYLAWQICQVSCTGLWWFFVWALWLALLLLCFGSGLGNPGSIRLCGDGWELSRRKLGDVFRWGSGVIVKQGEQTSGATILHYSMPFPRIWDAELCQWVETTSGSLPYMLVADRELHDGGIPDLQCKHQPLGFGSDHQVIRLYMISENCICMLCIVI